MSTGELVVVDYGVGNLLSVRRAFQYWQVDAQVTSDAERIAAAGRVVLPGVGAFGNAIAALEALQLVEVLRDVARRGVPVLGICLGAQLFLDESEEFGLSKGLGLIPGRVVPIPQMTPKGEQLKIPHIGWNGLLPGSEETDWTGTILGGTKRGSEVYFVHSFKADVENPAHLLSVCDYGGHRVAAVLRKDNVVACQFHPEKSGAVGLEILRRFLEQ